MAKLIFTESGEEKEVMDGFYIKDACEEVGIPFSCSDGICGVCIIEVEHGMKNLSEFTDKEKEFFGNDKGKERLACECRIIKGTVKIKF